MVSHLSTTKSCNWKRL